MNIPHENFDGTNSLAKERISFPCCLPKIHSMSKLILTQSPVNVNLIPQNHKGYCCQLTGSEQLCEFLSRFREPLQVGSVHNEYNTVYFWKVISPKTSCLLVTSKVKRFECVLSHVKNIRIYRLETNSGDQSSHTRMTSGIFSDYSSGLQRQLWSLLIGTSDREHTQKCGFAGIIEPEEEEFSFLFPEPENRENIEKPTIRWLAGVIRGYSYSNRNISDCDL
jgi:virulence-associated protein VapD